MINYLVALISVFFLVSTAPAGTIYIWTDAQGVKHYADQPPPEGVKDYDVAQGVINRSDSENREGFKQMMQEIEQENLKTDQEREAQKAAREAAEAEKKAAAENARIEAEQARLQEKIDALNNRALSPTFTEGMRRAQIEAIQKEMDNLK